MRPILVYDDVQAKRTVAITADGGTICVAAMNTAALGPTRLGGTNALTGMMMTGLTVLGMATRVVAAPLIDRIGRKKRLVIGSGMKDGNTDRLAKAFAGGAPVSAFSRRGRVCADLRAGGGCSGKPGNQVYLRSTSMEHMNLGKRRNKNREEKAGGNAPPVFSFAALFSKILSDFLHPRLLLDVEGTAALTVAALGAVASVER